MSAILSSDDLNDFISPGVACIKPVETLPAIKPSDPSNPYQVTTEDTLHPSELPPAQISLTDCLACSGCVTSAEAVLVSLQSHNEVLSVLDSAPAYNLEDDSSDGRIYVASVSPQTRASIAATFNVTERQAGHLIQQLLSGEQGLKQGGKWHNGFQWVLDTNITRDACLVYGAEEVTNSLETSTQGGPVKPILTSSCPGWICYAEKTHPHVLPHLSRLKSPQALMGTLIKSTLQKKLGIDVSKIWHVAIMPCFDKKLEASRKELTDDTWNSLNKEAHDDVRDVDCVITTKELLMLADSRDINFAALPHTPVCSSIPFPDSTIHNFLFSQKRKTQKESNAGTSGGNLYHILQTIVYQNPGSTIKTTRGKNVDVVNYAVIDTYGKSIFEAARLYGFRNIQNLVRKLKPEKTSRLPGRSTIAKTRKPNAKMTTPEYAYAEVMACPGGCTNGGGQIKLEDAVLSGRPNNEVNPAPLEQKQWLAQVDEAYFSGDESEVEDVDNAYDMIGGISPSYIKHVIEYWSRMTNVELEKLVYTSYREVVSDVGKKVTDTERVVEISSREGGGW